MELSKESIAAALKGDGAPSVAVDGLRVSLRYANAAIFGARCSSDDDVMRMGLSGMTVSEASQADEPPSIAVNGVVPPVAIIVTYSMVASAPVLKRSK